MGARGEWDGRRWDGRANGGGRPFMARFGCLFGAFFLLMLLGFGVVVWLIGSALGVVTGGGPGAEVLTIAFVLLVFIAIGGSIAAGSFRRIAGPLDELSGAAARVASGDLAARVEVPVRAPRPLRELVRAFNTMAERLSIDETQRRDLLADVSHELRTPLAIIQGNVEAMVDGIHPADADHLASVLEETRVLTRLVEDLRTVALAEAGTLALHRESTDVDALIAEAARGFRASAERAGIRLELDVPDDLPLADVDPVRIREVVSNLVANAIRHTPDGGTIRVTATARDRDALRITVADTGSGIEPDLLPHVFDRFAKSTASRGSGLGLAIAKDLVQAHGGTIAAESAPGEGTTVRFDLPLENRPA
jgi:signal transduction histidine kinase